MSPEELVRYFDREGRPITREQWSNASEDRKYKVLKQETVGVYWISTVWLGLNHNHSGRGRPQIFETMVFEQGPSDRETREIYQGLRTLTDTEDEFGYSAWRDLECERYATEAEALEGHARIVAKWSQPR